MVDTTRNVTLGDTLAAAALTSEKAEAALDGPPCPMECWHVWTLFLELHGTRGAAGMGDLLPITYVELDAFQRLTRRSLSPEEVRLLRAADLACRQQLAENHEASKPTPTPSE